LHRKESRWWCGANVGGKKKSEEVKKKEYGGK
jgi:hypothetical protein